MLSVRLLHKCYRDRASRQSASIGGAIVLLLLLAYLALSSASAATLNELEITREQNTYRISFDIVLSADVRRVRELLGDQTQWPRLSKKIKEGHLLETFPDGRERVSLSFRPCILIFCWTIHQVKDVSKLLNGDILADIVQEGDFTAGWERWRIFSDHDSTRVQYRAELIAGSRLAFLGSWVFKTNLRSILLSSANKIEMLATAFIKRSSVVDTSD